MYIGNKLKLLRRNNGVSRKELAKNINMNYWTLSKYENDERTPDVKSLVKIADEFNTSVDYLIGRDINHGKKKLVMKNN